MVEEDSVVGSAMRGVNRLSSIGRAKGRRIAY